MISHSRLVGSDSTGRPQRAFQQLSVLSELLSPNIRQPAERERIFSAKNFVDGTVPGLLRLPSLLQSGKMHGQIAFRQTALPDPGPGCL